MLTQKKKIAAQFKFELRVWYRRCGQMQPTENTELWVSSQKMHMFHTKVGIQLRLNWKSFAATARDDPQLSRGDPRRNRREAKPASDVEGGDR